MVLEASKKGKNKLTTPKHSNLEEQVAEENVGNFKNMSSLDRQLNKKMMTKEPTIFHLPYLPFGVCTKDQLLGGLS